MSPEQARLAVAIVVSLTLAVRLVAQHHAGGLFRDQADGFAREGGRALAIGVRLAALAAFVGIVAWVLTGWSLPGTVDLPAWSDWLGLALAEAGLVLLVWVHHALGVHVSGTLHLRDDHRLVQHGPYARVRHPMYTAFILLFTGIALLIGNVPIAVALLGTQVWTVLWRLPAEERSLHDRFGDAWLGYRRRTGTLTPWL